jgi:hypothetical protein
MTNDERMTKSENARDDEERFWNDGAVAIVSEEPNERRVYDLEERTARFGESVIDFARTIPQSAVTHRIIGQLVGAATSIGANYVEADDAVSKKGISQEHRHVPKGSARNETLPSDGRPCRTGIETASSNALGGSDGVTSHLLKDLEERKMIFVIRASSFLRHSSFVIRHFPHA